MLLRLLQDLGAFAPILASILLLVLALTIQWLSLWKRNRRLLKQAVQDAAALESCWVSWSVGRAARRTNSAGYGFVIEYRDLSPGRFKDEVLDDVFAHDDKTSRCEQLLGVMSNLAPLVGLLGTVAGFCIALSRLAGGLDSGSGLALMAGPAALAMKTTIGCLAVAILAYLVPNVFSLEGPRRAAFEAVLDLKALVLKQISASKKRAQASKKDKSNDS